MPNPSVRLHRVGEGGKRISRELVMLDVMAEPGTLAVEEIDSILAGIEYPGGIRIVVRQPDGTFRWSSTLWALGMHSHACRSWYTQRFGQPLPWWAEKLHPRHIVDLVKRCLACNQRLPQMYAGK